MGCVAYLVDISEVLLNIARATAEAAARFASIGPAARMMDAKGATAAQTAAIMADIAAGFSLFETDRGLRVPLTMTLLSATAPA